jgi:hypothetical protein
MSASAVFRDGLGNEMGGGTGFGKISKPLGSLVTKVDDERMKRGDWLSLDVFCSWHENILAHAPEIFFGGSSFQG